MNGTLIKPVAAPSPEAAAAASAGRKLRHAGFAAALLIIVGAVAGWLPRHLHRQALTSQTRELAVQTVAVTFPAPAKAAPGLLLPAEVKPLVEAPIYSRANGYLKNYLVDMGAQVKAGDILAEIDTPELNQELDQMRAQQAQAEAALALAKTTAARWADLVKTSSVSEQEAAEKQADLELKTATLAAAKANVHRLEDLRAFETVHAPFDGTITARDTDVGQLIVAGSGRQLFRLAQTKTLRVYVRVPQSLAQGVLPGQMAEMTVPEMPGRVFPAKVVRTSGAMTADSRTLLTELAVDNSQGEILSGTYAQVRFTDTKLDPPLTLPANTLLFRSEGPQVGIVRNDGKVELRSVTLGRDFGSALEILEGVRSNDQVVLNPADSLVSGAIVRIAQKPDETAANSEPATRP